MAWITMSRETLSGLERFKTERALPTWDATLTTLLGEAADAPGGSEAAGSSGVAGGSEAAGSQP
jgi:hypothetical protein